MTNTTASRTNPSTPDTQPTPDVAPMSGTDPRVFFARAVDLAGQVMAGIGSEQFGRPTPCHDFDVRAMAEHLVGVLRRVAVVGRGGDPFDVPIPVPAVVDQAESWLQLWTAAAQDVQTVWRRPGILARQMRLPWAELSGEATMAIYTAEVTVHTWDLAVGTEQHPAWDDAVVAASLAASERMLPADWRGPEVPFGPVVPVGDDAPLVERLVAWNGRHPSAGRARSRAGGSQ